MAEAGHAASPATWWYWPPSHHFLSQDRCGSCFFLLSSRSRSKWFRVTRTNCPGDRTAGAECNKCGAELSVAPAAYQSDAAAGSAAGIAPALAPADMHIPDPERIPAPTPALLAAPVPPARPERAEDPPIPALQPVPARAAADVAAEVLAVVPPEAVGKITQGKIRGAKTQTLSYWLKVLGVRVVPTKKFLNSDRRHLLLPLAPFRVEADGKLAAPTDMDIDDDSDSLDDSQNTRGGGGERLAAAASATAGEVVEARNGALFQFSLSNDSSQNGSHLLCHRFASYMQLSRIPEVRGKDELLNKADGATVYASPRAFLALRVMHGRGTANPGLIGTTRRFRPKRKGS